MEIPVDKPRTRRARQAEDTREDILQAARRQFGKSGYTKTSLKDIAAAAGVSVQTVYDSVGSKADLVVGLNDRVDSEARIGEIARHIETSNDPIELARIPARIAARLTERCGDILRVGLSGMSAEPVLAAVVGEGDRRHLAGTTAIAGRLSGLGALRDGLSVEDAAITMATLADARVALLLIERYALDVEQVESWIADSTARAVLRPELLRRARKRTRAALSTTSIS